ncbi:MAG TPA: serine/threonine-protein kinase [Solirubrobacterales bacterium]|nr:serine/threonine-protein kinase [Solirubrobacterales bacterium]
MSRERTVGHYRLLRVLGRGATAVVFLARQTDLDRLVALKELSRLAVADPSFAQRFVRESRLAGSLAHPNVVVLHEYFEHEGTPYIAMEYVPGGSMRGRIRDLSPAQAAGVLEGVLAALAHAEAVGVVHRDLKPENLMVTDDGRIKIADFGIARATRDAVEGFKTATGVTVGTPAYMAPEQAMGEEVGPWTDLYATGVLAYEMFTGRLPFAEEEAPIALLMRQVNERPPDPVEARPDLDPRLAAWVTGLLAKDPADRPAGAEQAWHELEDVLIEVLGPRWRRQARLAPEPGEPAADEPLTPAPFEPTLVSAEDGDDDGEVAEAAPGHVAPTTSIAARGRRPRRRRWLLAALATALVLAAGLGVALGLGWIGEGEGNGVEVEYALESPGDAFEVELPAGWIAEADDAPRGAPGNRRTRRRSPDGDIRIGINRIPSMDTVLSVSAVGDAEEDFLLQRDEHYQRHALEDIDLPGDRRAIFWEFDITHDFASGSGPGHAFAYFFELGGEIYRVQATAEQGSPDAVDVAAEVARHAASTLRAAP